MSRSRTQAVFLSVGLHLIVLAAGIFSVSFSSPMAMPRQLAIEATVVDVSILDALDDSKLQAELETELEAQRQQTELEELERQQAREIQEKLEQERKAEQARLEKERRAQEVEQQRIADETASEKRAVLEQQEKLKQAEREAAERAERLEQERLAELNRKKQAEQKRLADEKRQREEAQARKKREEEQRRQAEAESLLVAQLEEEERRLSAAKSGLRDHYALLIKQKIERNWLRPEGAAPGLECEVSVTQLPSREVVSVNVGKCNGDAAAVRSIEAAVYKASPLPAPPDPALFERKLTIIFRPGS